MRYLKLYEEFENYDSTMNFFKPLINWNLIQDLKDLSLEYLDEGFELNYFIRIDDQFGDIVFHGEYSSEKDISSWFHFSDLDDEKKKRYMNLRMKKHGFNYSFRITKKLERIIYNKDSMNKHANDEVYFRLSSQYPDEKISNVYDLYKRVR